MGQLVLVSHIILKVKPNGVVVNIVVIFNDVYIQILNAADKTAF